MAIASLASDIDFILRDCGQAVSSGALTVYGIVDAPDEILLAQMGVSGQVSRMRTILLRAGAIPGLTVGTVIGTGGASYKVTASLAVDDGQLVKVLVREA